MSNPKKDFSESESVKKLPQENPEEPSVESKETTDSLSPGELEKSKENPEVWQRQKIRQEIENIDLSDGQKSAAQGAANDIQGVEEKEKMEKLLHLAKTKGVVFAVAVVKKMNDPYLLDMFHDALAKEGHYKEFIKE